MKKKGSTINNYKKNEIQTLAEHSTPFKLPFIRATGLTSQTQKKKLLLSSFPSITKYLNQCELFHFSYEVENLR